MKLDIKLSGVGGQGILSIATVIGEAATAAGLQLKQAEVHGMSQRGGDVQSDMRLSTDAICSDLIPLGQADLIISMEPMEALRYLPYLAADGAVVTSSQPFVNIPNYPDASALLAELDALPHVVRANIETLAREHAMPKSANMILLGMAAPSLKLLDAEQLRGAIARIFARKGEAIVNANLEAFELGLAHAKSVSQ
ncbi:MAG: indolepyruvate oxidoreductase subunit beta [Bacteroidales bacterium]|nr:indolepyruvate oxidoreductase subunit beta [Bacteroidales bacterium]